MSLHWLLLSFNLITLSLFSSFFTGPFFASTLRTTAQPRNQKKHTNQKRKMEILTASFQVIFDKIVDYTIGAVGRQMGYLICYKKNVDNLRSEVDNLKDARNSVQQRVVTARKNVEEIEDKVEGWLTSVEEITVKAQKFFEEEGQAKLKCCNGRCFNLKTRYQLGRGAHKLELAVVDVTFYTSSNDMQCTLKSSSTVAILLDVTFYDCIRMQEK